MKKDLHPEYHKDAKITCSCGNVIPAGSTRKNLKTELCSKCHPFFTGQRKLVDTAGRVDKFKARVNAAKEAQAAKTDRQSKKKKKVVIEKIEKE